jgi:transketolase
MITIADGCRGFKAARLDPSTSAALRETARKARGDILKMTTLAGSGHPGGSMSSIDLYLTLHALARIDPRAPDNPARDRIVISHGHTSPGVYAALGNLGFFPVDEAIAHFRQAGGPFEGHVERNLPGVDWSSGNLGQGLSAGCGMALASNIRGLDNQVVVFMGDGEQQKGQIAEARRFAIKYSSRWWWTGTGSRSAAAPAR